MLNSMFWRLTAVAAVLAVMYVGHGLHVANGVNSVEISRTASAELLQKRAFPMSRFGTNASLGDLYRAKVQGGWLVEVVHTYGNHVELGVTFVPDEHHTWNPRDFLSSR